MNAPMLPELSTVFRRWVIQQPSTLPIDNFIRKFIVVLVFIGGEVILQPGPDELNGLAKSFRGFISLKMRLQQLFFGLPKLESNLFMNPGIAPNGKMVAFLSEIDQDREEDPLLLKLAKLRSDHQV